MKSNFLRNFVKKHTEKTIYNYIYQLCLSLAEDQDQRFMILDTQYLEPIKQGIKLAAPIFPANQLVIADQLDLTCIKRAIVWFLINHHSQHWNARAIYHLISERETANSRRELYNLCFKPDFPRSNYVLDSRSENEFLEALMNDLTTADPYYTEDLRLSYEYVASLLPRDDFIIKFVDSDHDHEVMRLFIEFAHLHGLSNAISPFEPEAPFLSIEFTRG